MRTIANTDDRLSEVLQIIKQNPDLPWNSSYLNDNFYRYQRIV